MSKIGTDRIKIHDKNKVRKVTRLMFSYVHMLNIIKILYKKAWDNKDYEITNLMADKYIIRAFCCNQSGGKRKNEVNKIKEYFKEDSLYKDLQKYYLNNANEKNMYYVLRDWVKDVKRQIEDKTYSFPKPKSLSKVTYFAFTLDKEKYIMDVENNKLVLKLGKDKESFVTLFLNYNNLQKDTLRLLSSIKVCYKLGHLEIHFHYKEKDIKKNINNIKKKQPEKTAGLDLGLRNIFTLFINDKDTESLSFSGEKLIRYNCEKNYRIYKLYKKRDTQCIKEYIEGPKKGKIPVYNNYYKHVKKLINDTFYYRSAWFDEMFHQMSVRVLEYCKKHKVTTLYVSRNIGEGKMLGSFKMRKNTKQKFYGIPFLRLIYNLKEKSRKYNIEIVEIDEAYTSKTSPFTSIEEVLNTAKVKEKDTKLSPTVYKGRRDGAEYYINNKKDSVHTVDADCVGAFNHTRIGELNKGNVFIYVNYYMYKLRKPVNIKSMEDFLILNKKIRSECSVRRSSGHNDTCFGMLKRLKRDAQL